MTDAPARAPGPFPAPPAGPSAGAPVGASAGAPVGASAGAPVGASVGAPVGVSVSAPVGATRRPRDLRLDFFRGLAMFIILIAHIPGNGWTLWIPARFGWSDATEIFVFCSGMASALAFGGAFGTHGFGVGTARIGHRIWQVYWAHVGMVLVTIALLWTVQSRGLGLEGKDYLAELPIMPFFEDAGASLWGLMTLTWVPNYFDILPMYLVILAMVPAVMAAHRAGGLAGVAGLCGAVWAAAQTGALDLPSRPWAPEIPWFFNPFGWQLVFFTGFALGMGWVRPPPRDRRLVRAAAAVLIVSLPFAWFRIHDGLIIPADWPLRLWIAEARAATEPLWAKTEQGAWRWLHFLALAYLAWVAVGPGGRRLVETATPWPAPAARWLWAAGAAMAVTFPYAWVDEIAALAPGLDAALGRLLGEGARAWLGTDLYLPGGRHALAGLVHAAAAGLLVWAAAGPAGRLWVVRGAWPAAVEVIRRVGSQSLAVFLVSMVAAQALGVVLDVWGRNLATTAAVNLGGMALLVAVARLTGWFRSEPWRRRAAVAGAPAGARSAG